MAKKVTMNMVAERAGVSRGTVDRVLHHRSYVKESVRTDVLRAMEELGYFNRENRPKPMETVNYAPVKLGVVLPNWSGHSRNEFLRGIDAATQELSDFGVEILVQTCKTDLAREVTERIDDLTEQGVRGIALCSLDEPVIVDKIDALSDAGIPVITFNSDIPQSKRVAFVGQDYVKSGRIAAELMGKCVPADAHILATVGNMEYDGHRSRINGFCERMAELGFPEGSILRAETYNDYRMTYKKVLGALEEDPRICGIYMANRSVNGCVAAVQEAKKKGKIRIICHDLSENTKWLLKEGCIDMTISQDLFGQGRLPLVMLREYFQKGKMPATDMTCPPIDIYCSENI